MRRTRRPKSSQPAMKRFARAIDRRWGELSRHLRRALAAALVLTLGIGIGLALTHHAPPPRPTRRVAEVQAPPNPPAAAPHVTEAQPVQPPSSVAPPSVAPPPPERPAPPPSGEPPWLRFAVKPPAIDGRAMVALVLDDLGLDRKRTERAIALPGPLTLSFMTYAEDLPHQAAAARQAGHELLLHVPMEPLDGHLDSGPNSLRVGLSREEVLRRLRWGLDRFSGYVGINNHMGSRFTSDAAAMLPVIDELRARGLLFLDSRTAASSVGEALAHRHGVPTVSRNVFLDDDVAAPAIGARLADLEQAARRKGAAVAIGHAHDATLAALAAWLPGLAAKHLVLVPLSTIVRRSEGGVNVTAARRGTAG
jgi:uncharacterized protein